MYKIKLISYIVIHMPYNMLKLILHFIVYNLKNIFCKNTPPNNYNVVWKADNYKIIPTPLDIPPV